MKQSFMPAPRIVQPFRWAAFAVLVARHRTMAWRLCRQLLRDQAHAEDGVREAVLLAWLNLDKLRQVLSDDENCRSMSIRLAA